MGEEASARSCGGSHQFPRRRAGPEPTASTSGAAASLLSARRARASR